MLSDRNILLEIREKEDNRNEIQILKLFSKDLKGVIINMFKKIE